jgi:hypothetical protein
VTVHEGCRLQRCRGRCPRPCGVVRHRVLAGGLGSRGTGGLVHCGSVDANPRRETVLSEIAFSVEFQNGGGQHEAFDRVIGVASHRVHSREYGRGQRRGVLPIRCLSGRMRRKARRRAAAAAGGASRGETRRWCCWCWRAAWNTAESWRSGQSSRPALTGHVPRVQEGSSIRLVEVLSS